MKHYFKKFLTSVALHPATKMSADHLDGEIRYACAADLAIASADEFKPKSWGIVLDFLKAAEIADYRIMLAAALKSVMARINGEKS